MKSQDVSGDKLIETTHFSVVPWYVQDRLFFRLPSHSIVSMCADNPSVRE